MTRNALLLLLTGLGLPAAQAQDALGPLDRFGVSVGMYNSRISLEGRIRGEESLTGDLRQFSDDFGLESRRPVQIGEISWSPFERHEISLRYSRDSYRRHVQLSEELRIEDQVFPIDAELLARANFSSVELDYVWWVHAGERNAVGLQVGVLRLTAGFSLEGTIASEGTGSVNLSADGKRRLHAPLIGVSGRQVFGERLRGFAELRAIRLDYGSIEGTAVSANIGLEYFFTPNIGLALQYADTRVRADRGISRPEGRIDGRAELGLSGAQALLKLRF